MSHVYDSVDLLLYALGSQPKPQMELPMDQNNHSESLGETAENGEIKRLQSSFRELDKFTIQLERVRHIGLPRFVYINQ